MGKMLESKDRYRLTFIGRIRDTIRVSLTEDPVQEIPVARDLARRANYWWSLPSRKQDEVLEEVDPFSFSRRQCDEINLSKAGLSIGPKHPPSVLAKTKYSPSESAEIIQEVAKVQVGSKDTPVEGLILSLKTFLRTTRFGYSSFFITRGNPLPFN